jgi:hypothetical protein
MLNSQHVIDNRAKRAAIKRSPSGFPDAPAERLPHGKLA